MKVQISVVQHTVLSGSSTKPTRNTKVLFEVRAKHQRDAPLPVAHFYSFKGPPFWLSKLVIIYYILIKAKLAPLNSTQLATVFGIWMNTY